MDDLTLLELQGKFIVELVDNQNHSGVRKRIETGENNSEKKSKIFV